MGAKEIEAINQLTETVKQLRASNDQFKETINGKVAAIQAKHVPLNLERDILSSIQASLNNAINTALTAYDNPVSKLVKSVAEARSTELRSIIASAFDQAISTESFKESILDGFTHKIARTIISSNDSMLDKVSSELKQDSVFKAKMQVAVAKAVEEYIADRNHK